MLSFLVCEIRCCCEHSQTSRNIKTCGCLINNPNLVHGFSTRWGKTSPDAEAMLFMSTDAKLDIKEKNSEVIFLMFLSLFLASSLLSCFFKVDGVLNGVEGMKVGDGEQEEVKQPRVTKAQKRRVTSCFALNSFARLQSSASAWTLQDKKAAQEKERESRIADAEVENLQGARHQEGLILAQKLAQKQLQIREISSDGHCLYRAVEDQLAQRSKVNVSSERRNLSTWS